MTYKAHPGRRYRVKMVFVSQPCKYTALWCIQTRLTRLGRGFSERGTAALLLLCHKTNPNGTSGVCCAGSRELKARLRRPTQDLTPGQPSTT